MGLTDVLFPRSRLSTWDCPGLGCCLQVGFLASFVGLSLSFSLTTACSPVYFEARIDLKCFSASLPAFTFPSLAVFPLGLWWSSRNICVSVHETLVSSRSSFHTGHSPRTLCNDSVRWLDYVYTHRKCNLRTHITRHHHHLAPSSLLLPATCPACLVLFVHLRYQNEYATCSYYWIFIYSSS